MSLLQIIILSITEGLTEFLPISSTAHLIILQKLFGMGKIDHFLTTLLQFGAILAAAFYFRKKILNIVREVFHGNFKYLGNILISSIPILLVAFLLKDFIQNILQNNIYVIIIATLVGGLLFYIIERKYREKVKIDTDEIKPKSALLIGLWQVLSIIPGMSRSGVTISGGLTQQLSLEESIEYAFILSLIPLTAGSLYELTKYRDTLSTVLTVNVLLGMGITFIVSILSIHATLGILKKSGFKPFVIYRILLALFLILLVLLKVI